MTAIVLSLVAGAAAGLLHVLTGPDHLAAIAPLATDGRRRAWRGGAGWGLGHTGGVGVIAAAAFLLRGGLPLGRWSALGERLVGAALVGIGFWGLRQALRGALHVHHHRHDGAAHVHPHLHLGEGAHDHPEAHTHTHAAFAMGLLHGAAGGAHVLGVLPALALPAGSAAGYLAGFGAGTIAAMAGFAAAVGALGESVAASASAWHRRIALACSVTAIVVGGVWLAGAGF